MPLVGKSVLYNLSMDKENTIVIFGRSLFINEIKEFIPELIKNYHTIGINSFYRSFPDVEYTCFADLHLPSYLPSITSKLIMSNMSGDYWKHYKNKEVFCIEHNSKDFSQEEHILNYCFHTPSIALNWAYLKGFKNVVLAGIDLINHTGHFDAPDIVPNWSDDNIKEAINHIEKIATQYLNVYTVNPNSIINIPFISVEDLLRKD